MAEGPATFAAHARSFAPARRPPLGFARRQPSKRTALVAVKVERRDEQLRAFPCAGAAHAAFERADPIDTDPGAFGQRLLRKPGGEPKAAEDNPKGERPAFSCSRKS